MYGIWDALATLTESISRLCRGLTLKFVDVVARRRAGTTSDGPFENFCLSRTRSHKRSASDVPREPLVRF